MIAALSHLLGSLLRRWERADPKNRYYWQDDGYWVDDQPLVG